ncbi:expressed unknown protein [Seminavis robusta]|uniref:Uncharacterized protein n=1 Tax=Seminavis robusta TaxID=568900 RepID=A0A9N8HUF7_9STRA|nr:expressed unknown protein [Seminavis robusta]|eukprot:Sro1809_g299060.1 n/a (558) ;mRNA; r:9397-11070
MASFQASDEFAAMDRGTASSPDVVDDDMPAEVDGREEMILQEEIPSWKDEHKNKLDDIISSRRSGRTSGPSKPKPEHAKSGGRREERVASRSDHDEKSRRTRSKGRVPPRKESESFTKSVQRERSSSTKRLRRSQSAGLPGNDEPDHGGANYERSNSNRRFRGTSRGLSNGESRDADKMATRSSSQHGDRRRKNGVAQADRPKSSRDLCGVRSRFRRRCSTGSWNTDPYDDLQERQSSERNQVPPAKEDRINTRGNRTRSLSPSKYAAATKDKDKLQRHFSAHTSSEKRRPKLQRSLSFDSGSGIVRLEEDHSRLKSTRPAAKSTVAKRLTGQATSSKKPSSAHASPRRQSSIRRLPPRNGSLGLKGGAKPHRVRSKSGQRRRTMSFGESSCDQASGGLEVTRHSSDRATGNVVARTPTNKPYPDDIDSSVSDIPRVVNDLDIDLSISDVYLPSDPCSHSNVNKIPTKCQERARKSLETSRTRMAVETLANMKLSDSHTTVTTVDCSSMEDSIESISSPPDRNSKVQQIAQQILELRQSWKDASTEAALQVPVPRRL